MSASSIRQDIVNVPNMLTMGRIVVIPLVMWLIVQGDPSSCVYAALLFTAASITDWLDGYIARKRGLVSITGKFLDPLADKLLIMAVLIVFVQTGQMPAWVVVVVVAREITITALRAMASAEGMLIASSRGGKYKTAFQMVGLLALMVHFDYFIHWGFYASRISFHDVGLMLFIVSVGFSLWSGGEYFLNFIKSIDTAKSKTGG